MAIIIPPPSVNNQGGAVLSLEYAILSVIAVISAFTMGTGVQQYIHHINQQFITSTDELVDNLFNQDLSTGQKAISSDGELARNVMRGSNRYTSRSDLWTHIG